MVGRALCLAALASVASAQDPVAPDSWPVAVEWSVAPLRPYPGQPVDVVLRVELPAAFADEQLIPRFRQPLDVHLEARTPFGSEAWGASPLTDALPEVGPRIALDGERVRLASVERQGLRTLEHRTRWSFDAAGSRLIEPAIVTGRWATSWRTDFLGQRTPADALEGRSASRAFSFDVRPFPEEGRPPSFADAVGSFRTRVELSADQVAVGEVLGVAWTVAGEGNLDALTPPAFSGLEDFHLLGIRESRAPGERTLRADLRALDPRTAAFPPLAFAAFDPVLEDYVDLATAALPLTVVGDRALPKPANASTAPPPEDDAPADGAPPRVWIAAAAAAGSLWVLLRWVPRHPRVRHARALARFESALARGEAPRKALARFAVERLDLGPYAPFDPRFDQRLLDRGARPETVREWSAWIRADLAAQYGGPRPAPDAPSALARRLHRELLAGDRG